MKVVNPLVKLIERIPLVGYVLKHGLELLLRVAWRVPFLSRIVNRGVTNYVAKSIPARPRPFSLWSPVEMPCTPQDPDYICDFTSWPSLSQRRYSGRHLPPAAAYYTAGLPLDTPYMRKEDALGRVTALFERRGQMMTDRSSLLFMFFAQWFTDSVLRVDGNDRRKNTSNHDVDLCQIYGLSEEHARLLRAMNQGKLTSQMVGGEEYPDYLCEADGVGVWKVKARYEKLISNEVVAQLLDKFEKARWEKLYATGLERGNSSIGYVAISTLFLREHNRICDELHTRYKSHPEWNDERYFQTARMINIVLLLKLVVEDYINHISGHQLFRLDPDFAEQQHWYRTNWIAIEFDLLYRWHGLVPDTITVNGVELNGDQFRNNNLLLEQTGLGPLISASSTQAAGRIGLFNTPDFLWAAEYQSIKMSRDFRLRSYNDYREQFGLNRCKSFDEFTSDKGLSATLKDLYGTIDNLEFLIGLFGEKRESGLLFGQLLNNMVAYDALTQIYTNPLLSRNVFNERTFTAYGMELIRTTSTIQQLAERNTPAGSNVLASLSVRRE